MMQEEKKQHIWGLEMTTSVSRLYLYFIDKSKNQAILTTLYFKEMWIFS